MRVGKAQRNAVSDCLSQPTPPLFLANCFGRYAALLEGAWRVC